MKRVMSIFVTCAALGAGVAFGAPCAVATVDAYVGLGATGCSVNNILFSNFTAPSGFSRSLLLNPIATLNDEGFTVTSGSAWMPPNEGDVGFSASTLDGGDSILGVRSAFSTTIVGTSAATAVVSQAVCAGGGTSLNGNFTGGCPGPFTNLTLVRTIAVDTPSDAFSFLATKIVVTTPHIQAASGAVTINSFTTQVQSRPSAPVPEPSMALIAGIGCFVAGAVRARRPR